MSEPREASASPGWANDIAEFIYTSVQREYGLGVEEFIAVQRLLVELAARDAVPGDADALAALLSPILCTTRAEQEALPGKFKTWLLAYEAGRAPERISEQETSSAQSGTFQKALRWYRILTVLALLAAIGGGAAVYRATAMGQDEVPTKPALVEPSDQTGDVPSSDWLDNVEGGTGKRAKSSAPEETPSDPPPAPPVPRRDTTFLWLFFFGFLLLLWLFRRLFIWWQGRRFLNRGSSDDDLEVRVVGLREFSPQPGRENAWAARHLRARQRARTEVLDVQGSVRATARSGGVPQLVFRKHTELPEYLCLVERRSSKDHVAAFAERQLEDVCAHGVFMKQLHFHTDPHVCFEAGGEGRIMSLSEVESIYSGHRLLLVADGTGLMDPQSGDPAPYLDEFSVFRSVSLLTPEPKESWGRREQMLRESGVPVLPLSAEGLGAVRQRTKRMRGFSGGSAPPFPPTFERDARLWLHDDEPDQDMITSGLRDLRRYLGESGFLWLAACAVYPELKPELTHELGQLLKEKGLAEEFGPQTELRLSRLPWFRHGHLPDWLRLRLLHTIPENREAELRSAMQQLFLSSLDPSVLGRASLEIALDERQLVGSLWRRLSRAWGKQGRGPWSDRVFLDWTGNRLSFRLPSLLVRSFSDNVAIAHEPLCAYRTAASGALIVFTLALIDPLSWTLLAFPWISALPYVRHYLNRKETRPALRTSIDLLAMCWTLIEVEDLSGPVTAATLYLLPLCAMLPALVQGLLGMGLASLKQRFRATLLLSETPWLVLCTVPLWIVPYPFEPRAGWAELEVGQLAFAAWLLLLVAGLRLLKKWQSLIRLMDFLSPGRWLLGQTHSTQRPQRAPGVGAVLVSSSLSWGLSAPFLITALLRRSKRDLWLSPLYFLAASVGLTCTSILVAAYSGEPYQYIEMWPRRFQPPVQEDALLLIPLLFLGFEIVRRTLGSTRKTSSPHDGKKVPARVETPPTWVEATFDALSPIRLLRRGPRGMLLALAIPLIYLPSRDLTHHLTEQVHRFVDVASVAPPDPTPPPESKADPPTSSADATKGEAKDEAKGEKFEAGTKESKNAPKAMEQISLNDAQKTWPEIYAALSRALASCNVRLTAPGKKPAFTLHLEYWEGVPSLLDHPTDVPRALQECINEQAHQELPRPIKRAVDTLFIIDVSYLPKPTSTEGTKGDQKTATTPAVDEAQPAKCAPGDPLCSDTPPQKAPQQKQKAPVYLKK